MAASRPKKKLTSATKSNDIAVSLPYWDERVEAMAAAYPEVRRDKYHIDILTARFVLSPERFDVVVASNLFGDVLSDLGPACAGTIGIAPAANLNPERASPRCSSQSMGRLPTLPERASPSRSPPSGRARSCWIFSVTAKAATARPATPPCGRSKWC
jgi:tartrate dehydrogenase/decarboxylase / D-malate dehydrogenase